MDFIVQVHLPNQYSDHSLITCLQTFTDSPKFNSEASENQNVNLTFDFLNFGNLLNSNWGIPKVVNQSTLLNYRGQTNGVPTYRLNAISGTSSFPTETFRNTTNILGNTWRLQMGIKYIF